MIRSQIVGCGAYLPGNPVSNAELARRVDTSDEWIQQRTGITQRFLAADGELTSDQALQAAQRALDHAGLKASEIDLIVLATATPHETFPATATKVQAGLGMTRGAAFDVQAVCSGFVYGLSVADRMMKNAMAQTALVIGAETFSRILDWNDRGTWQRARDLGIVIGSYAPGPMNAITDVAGVKVGHATLIQGEGKLNPEPARFALASP